VLGAACQEWVVSRFSEDLVVDRLTEVYSALTPLESASPVGTKDAA
jgi:hypothetical protein